MGISNIGPILRVNAIECICLCTC